MTYEATLVHFYIDLKIGAQDIPPAPARTPYPS